MVRPAIEGNGMEEAEIKAAIIPLTPFRQNCSVLWCARTTKGAVANCALPAT